ncbi:MAG: cytochrome c3 family protein [Candidatus Hydrogenedentes bacterium]|nr:cytochrome c3 family protein [Candidatus Hydrogenedentota bacterium]
MIYGSDDSRAIVLLKRCPARVWVTALVVVLSLAVGACLAHRQEKPAARASLADRGFKFPHVTHKEQGIGCTDCHVFEGGQYQAPNHELCSTCHEILNEPRDAESCKFCHLRADQLVDDRVKLLTDEQRFSHETHIAKGLDCTACHEDPNEKPFPEGPLMPFCMDCHGKTEPKLLECKVCHTQIDKDVRPQYRGKTRIQHDAPEIWKRVHGQESKIDPAYCALCHDAESSCEDCHRKTPPDNHTITWRRKLHGLHAEWDRNTCAICHEEDSCLKCHKNTQPSSHRGGWGRPGNLHCLTCHYPQEKTNCTVCHEDIEHPQAIPSPHNLGIFPPNCALCHPGGLPNRAPHVMNSTVRCIVCH